MLDSEEGVRWIVNELHCRLDQANIGTDDEQHILNTMHALNNLMMTIGRHKVGVRFFAMSDTVHAPSWGVSHLAHVIHRLHTHAFNYMFGSPIVGMSIGRI